MCLILDTNSFSAFFDKSCADYESLEGARNWVIRKEGKLVYGGEKYKHELRKARKYVPIFAELKRLGKVVELSGDDVDKREAEVRKIEPDQKFDDPHLVAIVNVSGVKVICTRDARAEPFLKDLRFYASKRHVPKIYKSARQNVLLVDANICDCCKPKNVLPRRVAAGLA